MFKIFKMDFIVFSCFLSLYVCLCTLTRFLSYSKKPASRTSGKFLGFKKISLTDFTQYTRRVVNPHPFVYTLLETEICGSKERGNVFLLIIVFTATENMNRRNRIRQSWASQDLQKWLQYAVIFPVGISRNWSISQMLINESIKHRDIIQENFYDTYYNLTFKSVMWLNWTATYCPQAKYILKIDDDMFVNIFSLMEYLENVENQTSSEEQRKEKKLFCYIHWNGATVMRDPRSKWYVSREEYNQSVYGTYCDGRAYILTRNLILPMYEASFHTKFFKIDDVYTTGFLTRHMGVEYVHIADHVVMGSYRNLTEKGLIFQESGAMPEEMYSLQWKILLSQNQ